MFTGCVPNCYEHTRRVRVTGMARNWPTGSRDCRNTSPQLSTSSRRNTELTLNDSSQADPVSRHSHVDSISCCRADHRRSTGQETATHERGAHLAMMTVGDSGKPAVLDASTPELPADAGAREADGERAVLMALHKSTGGPNWRWDRPKPTGTWSWDGHVPVGLWFGITTNRTGHITHIELNCLGLRGKIPPELGQLTNLHMLSLCQDGLSGPIPPELGQLTDLYTLHLQCDGLSGPLPPELGRLGPRLG